MANGQKLESLERIFKDLLLSWERWTFPIPLLEPRLADAVTQLHRNGEIVEWRTLRRIHKRIFARHNHHLAILLYNLFVIEVISVVFISITQNIRVAKVVHRSHAELELSKYQVEADTSAQIGRASCRERVFV